MELVKTFHKMRLLIATLLVAGCASLVWQLSHQKKSGDQYYVPDVLEMVSQETRLQFPPDARVVEFVDDGIDSFDRVWLTKIEFGETGLDLFKKSLSDKEESQAIMVGWRHETTSWWRPGQMIKARLYDLDECKIFVNVSYSSTGNIMVYIEHAVY